MRARSFRGAVNCFSESCLLSFLLRGLHIPWCVLTEPERDSLLPDVFIPHFGIFSDVIGQHSYALLRLQINNLDPVSSQPLNASGKILRLSHDHHADLELTDQTAAIPAGSERCYHHLVPVATLPAGFAESVRLGVHGRVIVLHPAIVSGSKKFTLASE